MTTPISDSRKAFSSLVTPSPTFCQKLMKSFADAAESKDLSSLLQPLAPPQEPTFVATSWVQSLAPAAQCAIWGVGFFVQNFSDGTINYAFGRKCIEENLPSSEWFSKAIFCKEFKRCAAF